MNTSRGNYCKTPNSFLGSSRQRRVQKVTTQFNIYEATFPKNIRPARCLEKPHPVKIKNQNDCSFSVYTYACTHIHTHTHTLADSGPSLASPLGSKGVWGMGSRRPIHTPKSERAQGSHVFTDFQATSALNELTTQTKLPDDRLYGRHTACFTTRHKSLTHKRKVGQIHQN